MIPRDGRALAVRLLRRLLESFATLALIVVVSFVIVRAAPGSPFASERDLAPKVAAQLESKYGLDRPLGAQLGHYLLRLAQGDLGPSLRYPAQKGRISGPWARGSTRSGRASAMRTRNIRSGRAFAQLRYARGMSLQAARESSSEQAMKLTALQAFDQNEAQGGQMAPIDSSVPESPAGTSHGEYGGGTAPLLSDPYALPDEQPSPDGAIDPGEQQNYQDPMDAIKQLAAEAARLKLISIILIAIGIALMCSGWWPTVIAGIIIFCIGIMMLMMAIRMGNQAKAMGDQLQSAYGQQYQKENVDACIDKAVADGTSPDACQSPNPDPHYSDSANDASNVQKSVNDERGSNWEYDDGQPTAQ